VFLEVLRGAVMMLLRGLVRFVSELVEVVAVGQASQRE
jgi:hypothetical protein